MHHRGTFISNNRTHQSNGDFTEGFQIFENNSDKQSSWIHMTEFFPIVKRGINNIFSKTTVKDNTGSEFILSEEECKSITEHWVNQISGFIDGESLDKKVKYLNQSLDKNLTVILNSKQLETLKKKNLV